MLFIMFGTFLWMTQRRQAPRRSSAAFGMLTEFLMLPFLR